MELTSFFSNGLFWYVVLFYFYLCWLGFLLCFGFSFMCVYRPHQSTRRSYVTSLPTETTHVSPHQSRWLGLPGDHWQPPVAEEEGSRTAASAARDGRKGGPPAPRAAVQPQGPNRIVRAHMLALPRYAPTSIATIGEAASDLQHLRWIWTRR